MRTIDGLFEVADGYTAPRPHSGDMQNRFYQRIVRAAKRYFRFAGTKATVHGLEHVPLDGGAMLAINHTGYLDFMLAGIGPYLRGERLVRFMAKKEVFGIPVIIRYGEPVAVDGTVEEATGRLKAAMEAMLETTRAEYETRFGPFEPGEPWMPASLGGSAPTLEEAAEIRRKEREAKKGK